MHKIKVEPKKAKPQAYYHKLRGQINCKKNHIRKKKYEYICNNSKPRKNQIVVDGYASKPTLHLLPYCFLYQI